MSNKIHRIPKTTKKIMSSPCDVYRDKRCLLCSTEPRQWYARYPYSLDESKKTIIHRGLCKECAINNTFDKHGNIIKREK